MIKRIYVESDNLKPLIEWLKTKPEGSLRILVGNASEDVLPKIMYGITREGRDLAEWVVRKIRTKQLEITGTPDKLDVLPLNEVVEG
jgi:hypothetical protein